MEKTPMNIKKSTVLFGLIGTGVGAAFGIIAYYGQWLG